MWYPSGFEQEIISIAIEENAFLLQLVSFGLESSQAVFLSFL